VPFVLLGASLLWFRWFGFNSGSSLSADSIAANAFTTTMVATSAGVLGWLLVEQLPGRQARPRWAPRPARSRAWSRSPRPVRSSTGWAASRSAWSPASCVRCPSVLKYRFNLDDSLDVVGVHFVGGWVGTIMTGLLCTTTAGAALKNGLLSAAVFDQLWRQFVRPPRLGVLVHAGPDLRLRDQGRPIGFRVDDDDEVAGCRHHRARRVRVRAEHRGGGAFRPVANSVSSEAVDV